MPNFTVYKCKVRLEGNVLHEVPKEDVTAAEIEMLRALHGPDAVVAIEPTVEAKRTDAAERARIKTLYINENLDGPARIKAKTEMFRNLFGHDSLPMPPKLADAVEEEDLAEDEVEEQAAPPVVTARRTRLNKPPEASFTE